MTRHQATEGLSFDQALARLPVIERHLDKLLARLSRVRPLPEGSAVADVGTAQGLFLIACAKRGLRAVGIEPWDEARDLAMRLADHFRLPIHVHKGTAEDLPLPSAQFDLVHANSVLEHARDVEAALCEARRVLRPGGVFWFSSASSLCPRQQEIACFPAFGWYPDRLKRRIMLWAQQHRPHLVGHTRTPALNWFTPAQARDMLARAGFQKVYDRWDLRLPAEGGRLHATALRLIQLGRATKFLADVVVPNCSYAAIK